MTDRTSFTAEEWTHVRSSVLTAGLAVTMAEPSGLIGMLQEGYANAKDLLSAKQDGLAAPLVKAVVADLETPDGRTTARAALKALIAGKAPAEAKIACLAELQKAAAILDAKAGADAAPFKRWLAGISQHVAEASTEGGFLGFGGVAVSENEKATLADVSRALGLA